MPVSSIVDLQNFGKSYSSQNYVWYLGLAVCAVVVLAGLLSPSALVEVPQELIFADESAGEEIEELRLNTLFRVHWTNLLFHFGVVGFMTGSTISIMSLISRTGSWRFSSVLVLIGIVCGFVAALLGTFVRWIFDGFILARFEFLETVADISVIAVVGLALFAPIMLLRFTLDRQMQESKVTTTFLAIMTSALVTPFAIAFGAAFGIVNSGFTTDTFPLSGIPVVVTWIVLVFGFSILFSYVMNSNRQRQQ
jgi:hypothetical protein